MKHLFGPVNSRRLGISLGVDLVPHKVCSLNCVYCECGATTVLTTEVKEYVPHDEVISELDELLSGKPELDVITFSGSGEPTLSSRIGDVIDFIKDNYPMYKIAVLTNSTLFEDGDVRARLMRADMIFPSLDAVSDDIFDLTMRPAEGVTSQGVIRGLQKFRSEYRGKIFLEVFIVPGHNDSDDELNKIREACLSINPDEIHLNRLDRPGAEEWVETANRDSLEKIKIFLSPLNVKLIGSADPDKNTSSRRGDIAEGILETIKRRPSTAADLSVTLGVRIVEVVKAAEILLEDGRAEIVKQERGDFYRAL